jgi:hypothetical protein
MSTDLHVTRIAHSCHLIEIGGQVILTDPWFTVTPTYDPGEAVARSVRQLPLRLHQRLAGRPDDHQVRPGPAPFRRRRGGAGTRHRRTADRPRRTHARTLTAFY